MGIKISQVQTQKQILAPTMQQSIEVLLLPLGELSQAIEEELQENPLLEAKDDGKSLEEQRIEKMIEYAMQRSSDKSYLPNYDSPNSDDETDARPITRGISMEEHLMQQLHLEITDPLKRKIGEYIIGNLDEHGFLQSSAGEIAQVMKLDDMILVEEVLDTIQHFDPVGIASRDLKECLLVQIPLRFNGQSELISQLVEDHLDDLFHKRFSSIAKKMKISLDEVKEIAQSISRLEPRPARKFGQSAGNIYIKSDMAIKQGDDDEFYIEMNNDSIPELCISRVYQQLLNDSKVKDEEKEFIKEKIKNAALFIRSIEQRGQTIQRIGEYILDKQMEFWSKGHSHLKPMTLKDVAESVDRNESTISRAISNKYIDTPQGLLPLKFFFTQAISTGENDEDVISNRSVKEAIRTIVEEEDKTKPLSDQKIQDQLIKLDLKVARRTISKYRAELKILPAHLRKE